MVVEGKDEISLRRFKWLLKQRGYRFWPEDRLEEVIQVRGTRPDFYVRMPWCDFLAEVESFEKSSVVDLNPNRVFTVNPKDLVKRISGACKEAARQLKPYANLGLPMVIVLDNWRQIGIPLDPLHLVQLFGMIEFRVPVSPEDGVIQRPYLVHGKSRRFSPEQHCHISAVVVPVPLVRYLEDDFTEERPMRVRVLHNPFANVPLPREVFWARRILW
uniref:Uncharacterized protein n=1 Tax=Ammonifex degensii TaxID=42838 RepID=A0A7C1IX73_9THEO